MMMRSDLPARSMVYILLCLGSVVAFVTVAIWPLVQSGKQLDDRYAKTKQEVEQQEILQPLFMALQTKHRQESVADSRMPRFGLPRQKIDTLYTLFESMAEKEQLRLSAVTPHIQSLDRKKQTFPVTVSANGRFADFRGFLVSVIKLPYLGHIERLQIEETEAGKRLTIELWLLLEKDSGHVQS